MPLHAASSRSLSLPEAIQLALRQNPNVQMAHLGETLAKFNVDVEEWAFMPHYSLQASANLIRGSMPGQQNLNIQPGISLQTITGATLALDLSNLKTTQYNPGLSLSIMQPLIRGFGKAIVEAALNNAKDTEFIARLNIEETLRYTVSNVINAYLDVVTAERTVEIDSQALIRAKEAVKQTKLFIKAGSKAGNELVTVSANVASTESQLENDKNFLSAARYGLLDAIGVDPNADVQFAKLNVDELIAAYHLVTLAETKQTSLMHDVQYQMDAVTLHGPATRNVMLAEDNAKWQFNLTANVATGNASGGGQNAGINSLLNGVNQSQSIGFTLQIPIGPRGGARYLSPL